MFFEERVTLFFTLDQIWTVFNPIIRGDIATLIGIIIVTCFNKKFFISFPISHSCESAVHFIATLPTIERKLT